MSDETTEGTGAVGEEQQDAPRNTEPKPAVSDAQNERRIRDLMSTNDKLRQDKTAGLAQQAQTQKNLTELQARLTVLEAERASQLEAANKSTQDALDAASAHEARAATLDDELAKTKLLADNPELAHYKATILATPRAQLETVLSNLKEAAALTRTATVEQLKTGYIAPSNPARTGDVVMNAQQLREYLKPGTPGYEDRLREAQKATHTIGRPA